MRAIANKPARRLLAAVLSLSLLAPALALAEDSDEDPSALAMVGDALVARPLGIVFTAVGAVTYLVTLPFSLAGGNAKQAGQELVVGPAEATFVRCLGCVRSGYHHEDDPSAASDSMY